MGAADMKRIRTVGLCLVAVFACSALAASSAMAGEYGKCVAVAKVGELYHGKWIDKACEVKKASEQEVAEGGKKNKYEWVSAAGTKFKSTSKLGTLSSAGGSITCRSSTAEGQVTGWQTGTETVLFKECLLSDGSKCTSFVFDEKGEEVLTAPQGDILTFALKTGLLDHGTKGASGLEPKEGETWTELLAEPGNPVGIGAENLGEPLQVQYVCSPGVVLQTSGTFSGVTAPVSKMYSKFETMFGVGKGEQDLKTIAFVPEEVNTGANVDTVAVTAKNEGKVKTEIRECNEAGAVSEGKGVFECEHQEPPF